MIKAIFFDTSDTLYNSEEFQQAQSAQPIAQLAKIKQTALDEAEEMFEAKKEALKQSLDHVTKVAVMMEFGVSRMEMQECMAQIDAQQFLSADVKLFNTLKKLSEDYRLGIISNILEKAVVNVLEALRVEKTLFSYLVTVNNTVASKPNPEPFLKAVELSGLEPDEIVYVGDSLTKDIIPAKQAGMKTVWVTQEKITDDHVDATISSIYEIESVLPSL